jgi:uncharacterized protein (TIGR00369 family)
MNDSQTGPHRFQMPGWISCAPFEQLLNISIMSASDGQAHLSMPFYRQLAQGGGLMHGGALVGLADTAVVMAIKSVVAPQTHFATVEMQSRFRRPVKQGVVEARAILKDRHDRFILGMANVFDEDQRLVLEFTSRFKIARDIRIVGVSFGDQPGPSVDGKL